LNRHHAPLPARAPDARLRPRGSSQGGLRQYNERVVLQAVRLQGALPGADIARLTGLTAQTVSMITKHLIDEGLLMKGPPLRGKVGQPSIPLSLDPDGAYAVGIKIGRRRLDTQLVDFTGLVRAGWSLDYPFPDPDQVMEEIGRRFTAIRRKLGPEARTRIVGVGLAAPLAMDRWQALLGVAPALAARWTDIDPGRAVGALCDWPVETMKDTAAACVAELVAGRGRELHSFLYVFVDTFVGGGIVIDGRLRGGVSGNAGAIGSMPLGMATSRAAAPQLLSVASLHTLEKAWAAADLQSPGTASAAVLDAPWRDVTQRWIDDAAIALAQVISSAACLLDLEGIIIDGAIDRRLLAALLEATHAAMARYDWEGVREPQVLPGTIGADAGSLGGALLPLHVNFAPDRDLFIKGDGAVAGAQRAVVG
jgi:predicted NBD/HSP70 family sugar kinase